MRLQGELRLQEDPAGTARQLRQLDEVFRNRSKLSHVRVLMDEVSAIDPAALLYMCARIGNLGSLGIQVSGTWPQTQHAVQTLLDANFAGFLGGKRPSFDSSTKTLQLHEGSARQRVQPTLAADVREFLKNLNPRLGIEEIDHINVAVMECVENVRVHAYAGSKDPFGDKRWYVVGLHDSKTHVSTVAILDLGVGVRSTVENQMSKLQKTFRWALQPTHDLIKEATLGLRTETGERHRGKGLRTLRDFAVRSRGRRLHVLSTDGMVSWDTAGAHGRSIPHVGGTIVSLEVRAASGVL